MAVTAEGSQRSCPGLLPACPLQQDVCSRVSSSGTIQHASCMLYGLGYTSVQDEMDVASIQHLHWHKCKHVSLCVCAYVCVCVHACVCARARVRTSV